MTTTCCTVLGLVMLVLTNLLAIVAFFTPRWIRLGHDVSRGLWAFCDPNECTWVVLDAPDYMHGQDSDWWRATQVLMCIGVGLTLFALLVATFMLCCERKGCNCSAMVAVFLIISALVMGVASTVFGVCANKYLEVGMDSVVRFSWSFWLTVAASGLAFFTSVVYALKGRTHHSDRNQS